MKIETVVRLQGSKEEENVEKCKYTMTELRILEREIEALQSKRLQLVEDLENNTLKDEILCTFDTETMETAFIENTNFDGEPVAISLPGPLTEWVPYNPRNLAKAIRMRYKEQSWEAYSDSIEKEEIKEENVCLKTCKGCSCK